MTDYITYEQLVEALSYDPETGVFTWLISPAKIVRAGSVAGTRATTGYIDIGFKQKTYRAHRLAWLYMTGRMPTLDIDHINGVRDDNRFANLREVDRITNMQNIRRPGVKNKSGYLGVSVDRWDGKWIAQITVNGEKVFLGRHESPELAAAAYIEAKRRLHPGCTI